MKTLVLLTLAVATMFIGCSTDGAGEGEGEDGEGETSGTPFENVCAAATAVSLGTTEIVAPPEAAVLGAGSCLLRDLPIHVRSFTATTSGLLNATVSAGTVTVGDACGPAALCARLPLQVAADQTVFLYFIGQAPTTTLELSFEAVATRSDVCAAAQPIALGTTTIEADDVLVVATVDACNLVRQQLVARTFTPSDSGILEVASSAGSVTAAPDCQTECPLVVDQFPEGNEFLVESGQPIILYVPVAAPSTTVTANLIRDVDAFNDICVDAPPVLVGDTPIDMADTVPVGGFSCTDQVTPLTARTFTATTDGRLTVRGLTTVNGLTAIAPSCSAGVLPICIASSVRVATGQTVTVFVGSFAPSETLSVVFEPTTTLALGAACSISLQQLPPPLSECDDGLGQYCAGDGGCVAAQPLALGMDIAVASPAGSFFESCFSFTEAGTYTLETTADDCGRETPNGDTIVRLRTDGSIVAFNDDQNQDTFCSRLTHTVAAGNHLACVGHFQFDGPIDVAFRVTRE